MSTRTDTPSTALATQHAAPAATIGSFGDMMANPGAVDNTWRLAKILAGSGIVPKDFSQRPEACFIALTMATELGENPMVIMQNMHVVHGTPGFSAKYMLGRLIRSGRIRGTVSYSENSKPGAADYAVTASAVDRQTGEQISVTVSMEMARAEGWTKNPKYKSMPQVMLRYRAVTFLVRMHYPDVMLGYHTVEELRDVQAAERVEVVAAPTSAAAALPAPTDDADLPIEERAAAMVLDLGKPGLIDRYRETFGVMPDADLDEMGMARALLSDEPPAN